MYVCIIIGLFLPFYNVFAGQPATADLISSCCERVHCCEKVEVLKITRICVSNSVNYLDMALKIVIDI